MPPPARRKATEATPPVPACLQDSKTGRMVLTTQIGPSILDLVVDELTVKVGGQGQGRRPRHAAWVLCLGLFRAWQRCVNRLRAPPVAQGCPAAPPPTPPRAPACMSPPQLRPAWGTAFAAILPCTPSHALDRLSPWLPAVLLPLVPPKVVP